MPVERLTVTITIMNMNTQKAIPADTAAATTERLEQEAMGEQLQYVHSREEVVL